jgi:signal transduction histidine kinase
MSLRQKVVAAFFIVLLLVGLQAGFAVLLLTQIVQGSARLVAPALNRIDHLAHLEADLVQLRTLEYTLVVATSPPLRQPSEAEIAEVAASITQRIEKYDRLLTATVREASGRYSFGGLELEETRVQALIKLEEDLPVYLDSVRSVVAATRAGDHAGALDEYLRFEPKFQALSEQFHALRHHEYVATEALRDQVVAAGTWARWPLIIVVLLVALMEIGLGWALSRAIARSLRMLEAGARRIAEERYDERVARPPEPELAALADTLNAVMQSLGANMSARERMEGERQQMAQERLSQIVRTQEEERARVSRELHDQAGQALTALQYGLTRVQHLTRDPAMVAELESLVALAGETGRQIGALARDLRPAVLDDLGLIPALRSYVREFSSRISLPIEFSVSGSVPRLWPEAETTIFRVVQEALTNVAKHARALHAWVHLGAHDGQLLVQIRDDGQGFDANAVARPNPHQRGQRPGLGLAGIRERVHLLGGRCNIESEPGVGTRLLMTFQVGGDVAPRPVHSHEEAVV